MNDRAAPDASPQAVRVPPSLSPAERKALRAAAHHLDPVVMLGDAGLSDAVVAETDRALNAHELIKVRVQGDDRQARVLAMAELCTRLNAAAVQSIGKLLVLYRPRPEPEATRNAPHQPKKQAGEKRADSSRATTKGRNLKPTKRAASKTSAKPSARPATKSPASTNRGGSTRTSATRSASSAGAAAKTRGTARPASARREGPAARREGPAARREGPAARRPASATARKRGSHS